MKNFKLYSFIGRLPVLVTTSAQVSSAATFEENCNIKQNDQIDFTCKIAKYISPKQENKFYSLFFLKNKLRLDLFDYNWNKENSFELIIKECSPEITHDNEILNITAQDYASYQFSKKAVNLEFEQTGTIIDLARRLMAESTLNSQYNNSYDNLLNFSTIECLNGSCTKVDNTIQWNGEASFSFSMPLTQKLKPGQYRFNFKSNINLDIDNTNRLISINSNSSNLPTVGKNTVTLDNIVIDGIYGYMNFNIEEETDELIFSYNFDVDNITEDNSPIRRGALSELKITKIIEPNTNKWTINELDINNFINSDINESFYKKVTLSLSGSNLYNGLIELATLFNATLHFDYINKIIYFLNKDLRTYKGVKLNPNYNINNFSRTAAIDDFITVLNVYGQEINDTLISFFNDIPLALKNKLKEYVKNNFDGEENFSLYGEGHKTFSSIATEIIDEQSLGSPEKEELINYCNVLDNIPNFDQIIYNIDYFYNIGAITETEYINFLDIIQNQLRKINIELKIIYPDLAELKNTLTLKEMELQEHCLYLNVLEREQCILKYERQHLDPKDEQYSSDVVGYQSTQSSNALEYNKTNEALYNLVSAQNVAAADPSTIIEPLNIESGEWYEFYKFIYENQEYNWETISSTDINNLYNVLINLYGYHGSKNNIFYNKIAEIDEKIAKLKETLISNIDALNDLNNAIAIAEGTELIKLKADRSGLWQQNLSILHKIGMPFDEEVYSYTLYHHNVLNKQGEVVADLAGYNNIYNYYTNAAKEQTTIVSDCLHNRTLMEIYINNQTEENRVNAIELYNTSGATYGIEGTLGSDITWEELAVGENAPLVIYMTASSNYYSEQNDIYLTLNENATLFADLAKEYCYIGSLVIEKNIYQGLLNIRSKDETIVDGLIDIYEALLANKSEILDNLNENYEDYLIEGYYEDSESVNSIELMQQAFLIGNQVFYPKVTYDIGIIDLSQLNDYQFLNIYVGDKIQLDDSLSLWYNPRYVYNNIQYLEIEEIDYDLRNPQNTKLIFDKQNQEDRLIQKLFLNLTTKK